MDIIIDNKKYEIIIKRKNVKYSNIKIRQNTLIITSSRYLTETDVLIFINKNMEAIKKLIKKIPQNPLKEDDFLLFGQVFKVIKTLDRFEIKENSIFSFSINYLDIYNYAYEIIEKMFYRIQNDFFKSTPASLVFKQMKTRWGVCYLKKSKIALTKAIIHIPFDLIEYVIIHEFSHFKYPNHSKDFYNYVSRYCPDYKRRVKELKSYAYVT